ncbi:MAG: hypothetical protein ACOXZV_02970 [Bacteroidales bacterium]|jgi:hypothetical protein
MMNFIKRYGIFSLLVLIALILLASKAIIWGLAAMGIALFIFGIQQLINLNVKVTQFEGDVVRLEDRNKALLKEKLKLEEENTFLKERHFQITQIKSILELNLFEIDTRFTRSVNKKEIINERNIKYFGSLSVVVKAKYGIDCKELRFKYIAEKDELIVANINPKFLSFGNRKLEWDFFEIYEFRNQNPLAEKRWMTSDDLYKYANRIKENYRVDTEKSLENGPEEFEWIYTPIRKNVENTIKVLFGGLCNKILIAEKPDDDFVPLEEVKFEALPEPARLKE